MTSLSVHILGGCRTQTAARHYLDDRFDSCLVIETADARYLLDCGNPAVGLLKDQFADLPAKPIQGIFISHWDGDHVNGLWSLLPELRGTDCVVALPVPPAELEKCEAFLALTAMPFALRTGIRFVPMPVGYAFERDGFILETLPNAHAAALKTQLHLRCRPEVDYHPSFSFRVRAAGRTVIYSADYTSPAELAPWFAAGADLAVLECAHTPPIERYLPMLAAYPALTRIAFTHFWNDRVGSGEVLELARRTLPGRTVLAATPGLEFRFADGPPAIIPFAERVQHRQPRVQPTSADTAEFCRQRGIPMDWSILGPFDNPRVGDQYTGLDQDHGVTTPPDTARDFAGKDGRRVRWERVAARDIRRNGCVMLQDLIGGNECLAYAHARFVAPSAGEYLVLAGSDDGMRMWLDGREVFHRNETRAAVVDGDRIPVTLSDGKHDVLLAVEQRFGGWMFFWRIIAAAEARP